MNTNTSKLSNHKNILTSSPELLRRRRELMYVSNLNAAIFIRAARWPEKVAGRAS